MNPAEWLYRAATRWPDRPALFCGTTQVADYAGFARAAAGLAGHLSRQGIGKGDRVAIFMGNATDYLVAFYGIWWTGAAVVPINARLHPREAQWIIDNAEAALTITDKPEAFGQGTSTLPIGAEFDAACATEGPDQPAILEPSNLAWLFYTSGTTGTPKGVMMTCGNIFAMTMSYFVDVENVCHEDATLYAAPMSHGAGIYNFMHVLRGARHVVPESGGFDPAEILALAPQLGEVQMFAAPTMVKRLVDTARAQGADGEGLRTIVYAGGPMYLADIIDAVEVLGPRFVQIYGQGECPMAITALPRGDVVDRTHPNWRARLASVGRAQSCGIVRIVEPDMQELPRGETGEIAVRGSAVMAGYWRNPKATEETIRDGWLLTGDVGAMDDDGFVTLQDRSKDMIISGGSNVYPREVEEVLLAHPGVSEAAVVGRPHPDWGEEVVAFIVGTAEDTDLDALCLEQIARYKRPRAYLRIDALPKNNYGKVLKTELRARLAESGFR